jgi:hypothetical protein
LSETIAGKRVAVNLEPEPVSGSFLEYSPERTSPLFQTRYRHFFENMYLKRYLGHQLLKSGVLSLELLYLSPVCITDSISGKLLFTSLREILQPSIIGTRMDTFPMTEVPNGCIPTEPFQYNADLLFSGVFTAGNTLDISDELFCFFCPGFSLPEPI